MSKSSKVLCASDYQAWTLAECNRHENWSGIPGRIDRTRTAKYTKRAGWNVILRKYVTFMRYLCNTYAAIFMLHLPCFSIFLPRRSSASQLRCSPGATCIATKRIDAHFDRRCHMDVTRIGFSWFFMVFHSSKHRFPVVFHGVRNLRS